MLCRLCSDSPAGYSHDCAAVRDSDVRCAPFFGALRAVGQHSVPLAVRLQVRCALSPVACFICVRAVRASSPPCSPAFLALALCTLQEH